MTIGHPAYLARVRANRALVEEHKGDLREAERLLGESISQFREGGDLDSVARNLPTLARILSKTGRLEEAVQRCAESLDIREQLGNKVDIGHSVLTMGKLLVDAGKPEQAIPHLERGWAIFQSTPWSKGRIEILLTLCEAFQDTGRSAEFRESLRTLRKELSVLPRRVRMGPVRRLLRGLVLRRRGESTDWSSFDFLR